MYKAWTTEGGIRCPAIVSYPGFGPAQPPISHAFTTVMDILPTILDLAGIKHPGKTFRSREVLEPRGASWVPHLSGQTADVHAETYTVGWELFGASCLIAADS